MKREIILAENSGFCFGVKRAIEKTEAEIAGAAAPVGCPDDCKAGDGGSP